MKYTTLFALLMSFNAWSGLIIVDQNDDLQNGPDGGCDLREAIQAANTDQAVDGCAAGSPNSGDIVLIQASGPIQLTDQIEVLAGMRITPPIGSNDLVEIRAASNRRIFHVRPPTDGDDVIELNQLHLTGGNPVSGDGGAVLIERQNNNDLQTIWITNSVFSGNQADAGGAVAIDQARAGSMLLDNNQFLDNVATDGVGGGLLYDRGSDELTVRDNLFEMNTAETSGGGAFFSHDTNQLFAIKSNRFVSNHSNNDGGGLALFGFAGIQDYELDRNVFLSNTANGNAGALYSAQSARPWIFNSVMAFNLANRGGAISIVNAYVYLRFSTLVHNEATLGAQIYGFSGTLGGISTSILAYPIGDENCAGATTALGSAFSVFDDSSCPFNAGSDQQTDPLLSGFHLDEDGYPAFLPAAGSPAIDRASLAVCVDHDQQSLNHDQQNLLRPIDGDGNGSVLCDLGASEAEFNTDLLFADSLGG
jgi:hypothetical protein